MPTQNRRSVKRDLLIDTALQLFSKDGYRATGIDKILAQSGVAKMTLYKHFKSKDELIIAALSKRDENFIAWLREYINSHIAQQQGDPRLGKLLCFFDALNEWFNSDSFYGCNFINASIEFKRKDDPIHVAAAAHKKLMIQILQEFLTELHLPDEQTIARQIHMIVEGAIIMALTLTDRSAGLLAKKSALTLLSTHDTACINPNLI